MGESASGLLRPPSYPHLQDGGVDLGEMVRSILAHLVTQDAAQGLQVWGLEDVMGRAVLARPDLVLAGLVALRVVSPIERSQKVVRPFTIYRRKRGVDDVPEGARQFCVDFHSFRRWFITKAEQVKQPVHFIEALVGHSANGTRRAS